MARTAVITGAGSGVGRAVAVALAGQGFRVALVGRRVAPLEETSGTCAGRALVCPCDVSDEAAVAAMAERVRGEFGEVEALVNAAGGNVKRRHLAEVSPADYRALVDTNLHGAFNCVRAFLPGMRARGAGTIVNIGSEAGKWANPGSGPGYIASKFGLTGLTQAINAEERGHGIRASIVQPGEIDTPILDQRPHPPDAAARARMLKPEDVAECVLLCIGLPGRAIVEEILVRPR